MGLTVNTNIASINAQRNLGVANNQLNTSLERLSSGLRINRAADDAAGLAIATKLGAQVRGLQQAARNANNTISLVQTAEGGLTVATNILQRLRELAVQSASDDNTGADRSTLNAEAKQLREELTRLANVSEFNGSVLLDGSFSGKKFQVGANANQTISFALSDTRATALGKSATTTADIGDGASQAVAGGGSLSAGEFTINGTNVLATSSTDDQVSVLSIGGDTAVGSVAAGISAANIDNLSLYINDTRIGLVAFTEGASTGAIAATLASSVNSANITDVSARVVQGSFVILEAKNGADISIYASGAGSAAGSAAAVFQDLFGVSAAFAGSLVANKVTTSNGQSSAIAKAAAINGVSGTTSVKAAVNTTSVAFTNAVASATYGSGDLVINGINIGAVTVGTNDSDGSLAGAINAQSSSMGVTASVSAGKLTLSASDGRNIAITATSAVQTSIGNSSDVTFTGKTGTVRASVDLSSTGNFTIGGTTSDLGSIATTTFVASGNLSTLDLSTQTGANSAITALDSALDSINSARSDIGAVQNRIQSTIDFLNVAAENQSAAESRIRDADFALETAKFTRAQILTQAATAILAQANSAPQVALQLLQ